MTAWKITGLVAMVVIILSIPLYLLVERRQMDRRLVSGLKTEAAFVGSGQCRSCHKAEFDKWEQSHHRWAMAPATAETVLGDFNDVEFEQFGVTSKFYRKDGKYFVYTQGPEGAMEHFQITHTFGWQPLQQYLVPFPGGRLQCLPIAWDVKQKRWYHLYPDRQIDPGDWLYWTNQAQNWNGMCAECHSTDLRKNYDLSSDTYQTQWSEISVGCEACHGPGSEHVRWAELPEMGRPAVDNYGLTVQTSGMTSQQQIELCAPCHSRRMSLDDNIHRHVDFLDYGIPQLLSEGMYHADGQILEEVYVYGSFMQSKMYDRNVRCSDCHDVHTGNRIKEGNALCLQCHKGAVYDTKDHHFHKKEHETGEPIQNKAGDVLFAVGSGALCEQCHMPGRNYMVIDYRPDHSFRIPRPDLTVTLDTPNACNRCHIDKTAQWSVDTITKWYGQRKRPHYGTVLAEGRHREIKALDGHIRLVDDRLYPSIVRATALSQLSGYKSKKSRAALVRSLTDEASLMRHTAIQNLNATDPDERMDLLTPLLYDPVKAVRIEAARQLVSVSEDKWPAKTRKQFEKALSQYQNVMERTADFAPSRHNLGNLCAETGKIDCAVEHYQKAIDIDEQFYPSKVNLAMLYNRKGNNSQAEMLLREVVKSHPDQYDVHYSLGLLLVEMNDPKSAVTHLQKAAGGLPHRSRIHYNLGLLHQQLKQDSDAEKALKKALAIEPKHPEYLYALTLFYIQRQRLNEAEPIATQMTQYIPTQAMGNRFLETIKKQRQREVEP